MAPNSQRDSEQLPLPLFANGDKNPPVATTAKSVGVKKLRLENKNRAISGQYGQEIIEGIPRLTLPTRWEHLQPKIQEASIQSIIKPIYQGDCI